ncbi:MULTISPECIES: PEP-CTERM domain protein [Methylomonas]|uniref:PEP-CTERM domain protein n=2 Tax=Methylomonas TaxID=416 RepID=A0A126T8H2_9GAMM|nr:MULTISPECIES: PEP-CTERM domain protein [Methylomonas]AMK78338.1 hypothetical protein JT25_017900 [Methylomonas denitrificans]OAI04051.1 hypothetical protein A1342_05835 [Methylomonas methanica]TCV87630.1 putative secreted protein [Methylomonas methanica]
MKHFAKTMIAAALLAGAGSANASIQNNGGGDNEAYLSAYDITTGKTFTLDTGVTYNTLVANVSNAAFSLNFDLSALSNWTNFITGATTSAIKYVVAVGNGIDFGAAITGAPLATSAALLFGYDTANAIQGHAIDINGKIGVINPAANLSTLVLDGESGNTVGQHGEASSVWGGWIQDPQASYGQAVGFQLGQMDQNTGDNIATTFAGQWKLAGNSLTFAAPPVASVPLPAAVWMFGAGLMGVLRLNRRKSMSV